MALRTAGSQLYALNQRTGDMFQVPCVTSIGALDVTEEMEEVTCIEDLAREYEAAMAAPGTTSFGIRFDYREKRYLDLFRAKSAGDRFTFALGFPQFDAEGLVIPPANAEVPTVENTPGETPQFIFGGERFYLVYAGIITNFPIGGEVGGFFETTVGIQISGDIVMVEPVEDAGGGGG